MVRGFQVENALQTKLKKMDNLNAPRWTRDEEKKAIVMKAQGATIGRIAHELGKSESAVTQKFYKLNKKAKKKSRASRKAAPVEKPRKLIPIAKVPQPENKAQEYVRLGELCKLNPWLQKYLK